MNEFVVNYWPFWLVNYSLALFAWCCVGRFALGAFLPPEHPNYIHQGFRRMTHWAVACARLATPSFVTPQFLPLVAFCWLMGLRWLVGLSFIGAGLAPRIAPAAGG